ncbi:MAG TPA: DUF6585 family protein [Ktedonobacteraceae bacterium]|jgi:hypothetical protein
MAWQNQPGQQMPSQPVSTFPGQPNTPFQGYPGMAYPQQPAIPPEAIAAAQSAGLGMPTREYRKNTSGNNPATAGVQSILSFTLLIVGLSVLVPMGIVLFVVPSPWNLISAGIIVVCILPFLPMLLRLKGSAGGGRGKKNLVAWSCPEGLVYSQNNQFSAVRWNDIRQVWRKVGILNGMFTTLAYIVEPNNAPPFSFSLLNGPFADLALNNTGGSMSISFGGGEISNNGGFVQISGNFFLTEYAGLGDLIEEHIIQQTLPRLMDTYRAGSAINFGPFVVYQQGMSDGTRELAWADVDRIQISSAAIQITKRPASMVWFNLSAATLPNFALLCAVLNTLQENKA